MKGFLFVVVLIYTIIADAYCWRIFHNGRVTGGNLGIPAKLRVTAEPNNFTRWFTQALDHFDVGNLATWKQRYFVNDEFFDEEKRNVAFIMVGGEGKISDDWMTNGEWVDNGREFNAILFQLEHRFYGESHPTEDLSVENLKYLTSEQALVDLAVFITAMNKKYNLSPDVKWIAFGGSYPGSLAAWARLKYPHLIHGAVSASGPLIAVPNFPEYFQVVAEDLRNVDENCYSAVKKGFAQIELLIQNRAGQKSLTSMFQLCDPLEESADNEEDLANFYSVLAGDFAAIAQYNKDNRLSTRGTLLGNITLDKVCEIMTNPSESREIKRLATFNGLMLKASNQSCTDFKYSAMVASLSNATWAGATGGRQWTFQTCNEFGFYQTSDNKPQIFGDKFPLEFSVRQCMDIFGREFNRSYIQSVTDYTNVLYGALDIEVSNVVFVHGSVDPWHKLGITQTLNQNAPAIFIKGTAHCANMYPPTEKDLPQLKEARVQIREHIQTWLDL